MLENQLLGYAGIEGSWNSHYRIIHYCYTAKSEKFQNLERKLLPEKDELITQLIHNSDQKAEKKQNYLSACETESNLYG